MGDTLGGRLREERNRLKLSQTRAAEIGGVSLNTQFKYEKDKSAPDADYLARLAEHGLDLMYVVLGRHIDAAHRARRYESPGDALEAVLAAQAELGLTMTADQIKALLEYAYKHHVDEVGIKEFVSAAYIVAGKPLDDGETKGEDHD